MRIISNSNGDYFQVLEDLKCPFNEKKDHIILKDGEIIYWQNASNYYIDKKLDIEMMKEYIDEIEVTISLFVTNVKTIHKWRSETRRQKTLDFSRETLSKMIAYKRELKIDKVLRDENEYQYWVC